MALSCGLDFHDRVDGSVGWPLPFVEARLVDTESNEVIEPGREIGKDGKEREGEIQLRGPTIFKQYWRNPEATASEFVEGDDGRGKWFKTGDVATRRVVEGAGKSAQEWARGPMFFIRGRKSVDIIKTGGEKVSALEIERELLSLYVPLPPLPSLLHLPVLSLCPPASSSLPPFLCLLTLSSPSTRYRRPQISECAVVGLPSEQWGQKVAVVVVLDPKHAQTGRGGKTWGVMDMRRALRERLANYKIPQEMKVVGEVPRNAMGKSECFLFLWCMGG